MSATLAHRGLPAGVRRLDLLSLVESLDKRGLGLSSTATRVLRHYVWRSRDDDYLSGRICAVWDRVCRTAENLDLCSRAINDAERELEAKGLIARSTGGNGARSGFRSAGVIRWAAGVNLAPLIERYAELSARKEARRLHQEAVNQCKAEIRHLRTAIRRSSEAALLGKAEAVLPQGRVARINELERLGQIKDALAAIFAEIELGDGAPISSDRSEDSCAPNIQNQNIPRICSAASAQPRVDPKVALTVASPDYRVLVEGLGGPTWGGLIETSAMLASWLGITPRVWGQACSTLGRERAALCILVIDRNARLNAQHNYRARHPGRCLSGMVGRAASGRLNLHRLLMAVHREDALDPETTGHKQDGRAEGSSLALGSVLGRVLGKISTPEGLCRDD